MIDKNRSFITIGRIPATFGIKGKVKVRVLTEFPERFSPGTVVYVDGKPMTVEIAEFRSKDSATVKFKSVDSIDLAKELIGKEIEIPEGKAQQLPEGKYYYYQLIGLRVVTTAGKELGKITEILTTLSNDNYVVSDGEGEILIPATDEVVKSVNLGKGEIVIEAIPGLLELNRKGNLS